MNKKYRCLWEIYCAIINGVPLFIALPPDQRQSFLLGLMQNAEAITDALVKIDLERSEAFKQEDRDNIRAAVRASSGGFLGLNVAVKDCLRNWYLGTTLALANEAMTALEGHEGQPDAGQDADRVEALQQLAVSLHSFGDNVNAIRLSERCVELVRRGL